MMNGNHAAHTSLHPTPQRITQTQGVIDVSSSIPVRERIAPDEMSRPQGYILTIDDIGVTLVGHDPAGLFYGHQTLEQLRAIHSGRLPCLTIQDWPDLLIRGYMLDISRDRVPTMATLKRLIDRLARLKLNQLQIYTEHTIAYIGHDSVWRGASPLTFDELTEIEAYCQERFIDLVPCQNLFGHMHRWLTKPDYAHLAECPDGWNTPWGYRAEEPSSVNPADPASFALSADLVDQLAAQSKSSLFNICCDETLDIGQGKSKDLCEREGRASVYLNYLQKLCERVQSHGKTPMFWGDIVLHHPELVPRLPQDTVLLNWGYEANHPFMEQSKLFQEAGVRFYVCGGTSSWCTLTGRGQNAVDNLRGAAEAAIRHGAEGYLITDWGDHGHWQPFAISWIGLTYGAGVAWALGKNRGTDTLPQAVSRIATNATTDTVGNILWELSNVYLLSDAKCVNATWWFRYLQKPEKASVDAEPLSRVSEQDAQRVLAGLESVAAALDQYRPNGLEAEQLKREIDWCIRVSHWACTRVMEVLAHSATGRTTPERDGNRKATVAVFDELVATYREFWLTHYRPGGLSDSVEKLTRVLSIMEQTGR